MTFAHPIPWWAVPLVVAAIVLLAYRAYARPPVPMSTMRRRILTTLRAVTLAVLVLCLLRPVAIEPASVTHDAVVPVLVDVSRSMRLDDGSGSARIERARSVTAHIVTGLRSEFRTEVYGFGDTVKMVQTEALSADAPRTELGSALRSIQEQYRGQRVAGVVVVTDGADTGTAESRAGGFQFPVYTVGIGPSGAIRDREVASLAAGQPALADSIVEIDAAIVAHGSHDPMEVRLLENGRPVQVRKVRPPAAGGPVHERFQVSPGRDVATLYTVEIVAGSGELTTENNVRSVLVRPPGRRRRILLVQGAPGFEHSFLSRAWLADPGIQLSSIARKGQNEAGDETYYIQAPSTEAAALAGGFPADRQTLFSYDAIVLANLQADFLTGDQLAATADFVSTRGGGLLILGGRSLLQGGLSGTALEDALPLELADRASGVVRAANGAGEANKVLLTADGESHPIMQLGASADETRRRWAGVPPLASAAPLGAPRPGATVLAVTGSGGRSTRPLVAVQRFGHGRSMIFTGEASWRWRMMAPLQDRSYETFWQQALRWLAGGAPDPVTVTTMPGGTAAGRLNVTVTARELTFAPMRDAVVAVRVTAPSGEVVDLEPRLMDAREGRYAAQLRATEPGVYRIRAEAQRKGLSAGVAEDWVLVGGSDPEVADPRLNEPLLRRVASASGGRYLRVDEIDQLAALLEAAGAAPQPPVQRDLWNNAVVFAAVLLLLAGEWITRRRTGLR